MPVWRKIEALGDWPLSRDVPPGEGWEELRIGGVLGMVNVLVMLIWWKESLTTKEETAEYDSILEDVHWVFECLTKLPPPSSTSNPTSGSVVVSKPVRASRKPAKNAATNSMPAANDASINDAPSPRPKRKGKATATVSAPPAKRTRRS